MKKLKQGRLPFIIFIFSITFVFLFLAALYESWSVPFSVLLAVPISAFGAILMLMWCSPDLPIMFTRRLDYNIDRAFCQKNAILIVEFAKSARRPWRRTYKNPLWEAVRLRLRPIIMTSLAFIPGCICRWHLRPGRSGSQEYNRIYGSRRYAGSLYACRI